MSSDGTATWDDPDRVDRYLERVERLAPRRSGEHALAEVIPAHVDRVLDLGCGDGRLASLVLDARPDAREVICADRSDAMLRHARQRFAGDPRVQVVTYDMADPLPVPGQFDLIVSGFAIHHLEHDRKRTLFAEIAERLCPGGVFANLEVVESATPRRHQEFLDAIARPADDPEDRLAPIGDQLAWMTAAGLDQAECIWRWRGFALLVGERGVGAVTGPQPG